MIFLVSTIGAWKNRLWVSSLEKQLLRKEWRSQVHSAVLPSRNDWYLTGKICCILLLFCSDSRVSYIDRHLIHRQLSRRFYRVQRYAIKVSPIRSATPEIMDDREKPRFIGLLNNDPKIPRFLALHCIIQREHLVAKYLSYENVEHYFVDSKLNKNKCQNTPKI